MKTSGKRVQEARFRCGLTQEELAGKCDINVRTIQRIENDEVVPRAGNLKIIGEVLGEDFNQTGNSSSEDRLWIVLMHLSSIIPVVIVPVIIYSLKKDEISGIEKHWKSVVNFQITMCIVLFSSSLLIIFGIGVLLLIALGPVISVITIINTLKVMNEQPCNYPSFKII